MYNDEATPIEEVYKNMARAYEQMLSLGKNEKEPEPNVQNDSDFNKIASKLYLMEICSLKKLTSIPTGSNQKSRRISRVITLKTWAKEILFTLLKGPLDNTPCDNCVYSLSPLTASGIRREMLDCQLFILEKYDLLLKSAPAETVTTILKLCYFANRCYTLL